jgi:hypothetical protein
MALYDFSYTKTSSGVVRTKSLFYETSYDNPEFAIFTLKEHDSETSDGRPLMSLAQTFIAMTVDDPTEVEFSDAVFGSWEVWDKIRNSDKRIVAAVEKWRKEADIRRKAIAFKTIVQEVKSQGRGALSAAKYLLEEPWLKGNTPDGRKSKAEARENAKDAFERTGVAEDIKRLREEGLIQ